MCLQIAGVKGTEGIKQCSLLSNIRELLFDHRWPGSGIGWRNVEVVFHHHLLQPLKIIWNATVGPLERVNPFTGKGAISHHARID